MFCYLLTALIALALLETHAWRTVRKQRKHAPASIAAEFSLEECLTNAAATVIFPSDGQYGDSCQMINRRTDIMPAPLAVVRPGSSSEIELAVSCAAAAGVQVCASDGLHGFNNKAGCTGGVWIQCGNLQDISIDTATSQVAFGSGWWLGGLYYHLDAQGLAFPGGSVNSVGATGLLLGCGRGLSTLQHGLACDSILSVQYVDATGQLQLADKDTNQDMFWMARGGGGEFPGIVTQIKMQAYVKPQEVYEHRCEFPKWSGKEVARKWLGKGPEFGDPMRSVFTSAVIWNHGVIYIKVGCLDCDQAQVQWADGVMDELSAAAYGQASCNITRRSWLEQILYESGKEDGPSVFYPQTPEGLLDRAQGWGIKPNPSGQVVSGRVGETWELSDQLWEAIETHFFGNTQIPQWSGQLFWYPIGGAAVNRVAPEDSAYGNRDATWTLHWKYYVSPTDVDEIQRFNNYKKAFQSAFDAAGVPCRNFLNYIDSEMTCADNGDEWREAHFSNVSRMMSIKQQADPDNVMRMQQIAPTPAPPVQGDCSPPELNCRETMCCQEEGAQCFEKNGGWASCLKSCTPGVPQPSDIPPWQTPWTCRVLPYSNEYPLDTPVFLRSHRNQQLKDANGQVGLTPNASAWETFVLRDTGDGMVLIESHRGENLQDAQGSVGFSPNTEGWEKWTIVDVGDGKVAFQSWFGDYLQDNNGAVGMSSNLGTWEMWSIVLALEPRAVQTGLPMRERINEIWGGILPASLN